MQTLDLAMVLVGGLVGFGSVAGWLLLALIKADEDARLWLTKKLVKV